MKSSLDGEFKNGYVSIFSWAYVCPACQFERNRTFFESNVIELNRTQSFDDVVLRTKSNSQFFLRPNILALFWSIKY